MISLFLCRDAIQSMENHFGEVFKLLVHCVVFSQISKLTWEVNEFEIRVLEQTEVKVSQLSCKMNKVAMRSVFTLQNRFSGIGSLACIMWIGTVQSQQPILKPF